MNPDLHHRAHSLGTGLSIWAHKTRKDSISVKAGIIIVSLYTLIILLLQDLKSLKQTEL